MTKRKGDFRSKIDSILVEGETAPPSKELAGLVSPTTETKTDNIAVGKIFLPGSRKADQDVSELLSSVRSRGVLQPILVRPVGNRFEVVDGARRLVAAQQTGRKTVPAVVRNLTAAEARAAASKDRPLVARSTPASRAAAAALAAGGAAAGAAAAGIVPASKRAAKPAARTVTASRTRAVRAATAKPGASAPARPAARAASTVKPATKPSPKAAAGVGRRTAPTKAGKPFDARPEVQTPAAPATQGLAAQSEAIEEAVVARPAATALVRPAPTGDFPKRPDLEEPDLKVGAAAATRGSAGAQKERGRSRSRAMAGWYVFLAVLAVASFSLTNLAINHDTALSIETGAVAGVGLVAVVVLLVTG